VIGLLRQSGVNVVETTMTYADFETADEIFATGNYSKVVPVTRIGDRTLPFGPLYTKARELYWAFAHS
jgi:branched-chain amino acid aminotransferase